MRRHILGGRAGTSAGSTGEPGLLTLFSHRQLFTCSNHLCPGQVIWVWGKGEPCCLNTSFWIKGWAVSQLVELDFALPCRAGCAPPSHRQGSGWSEQAQGTNMLPCGLCPVCPS